MVLATSPEFSKHMRIVTSHLNIAQIDPFFGQCQSDVKTGKVDRFVYLDMCPYRRDTEFYAFTD